jgi:hypothetical protein
MRTCTRMGRTSTHGGNRPTSSRTRARAWRSSTRTVRSVYARSLGVLTAGARVRPLLSRVVSMLLALRLATWVSGWDTRASSARMPRRSSRSRVHSWAMGRSCGGCGWGVIRSRRSASRLPRPSQHHLLQPPHQRPHKHQPPRHERPRTIEWVGCPCSSRSFYPLDVRHRSQREDGRHDRRRTSTIAIAINDDDDHRQQRREQQQPPISDWVRRPRPDVRALVRVEMVHPPAHRDTNGRRCGRRRCGRRRAGRSRPWSVAEAGAGVAAGDVGARWETQGVRGSGHGVGGADDDDDDDDEKTRGDGRRPRPPLWEV